MIQKRSGTYFEHLESTVGFEQIFAAFSWNGMALGGAIIRVQFE